MTHKQSSPDSARHATAEKAPGGRGGSGRDDERLPQTFVAAAAQGSTGAESAMRSVASVSDGSRLARRRGCRQNPGALARDADRVRAETGPTSISAKELDRLDRVDRSACVMGDNSLGPGSCGWPAERVLAPARLGEERLPVGGLG